MFSQARCVCWLLTGLLFAAPAFAQKPVAKAVVELRWVETKKVDGLTEVEGFQSSCDPDSIVYPHKKPALVLTKDNVAKASMKNHDLSRSGLSANNYTVKLELTKEAREALLKSCPGDGTRLLTVVINGKYWGLRRYEKVGGVGIPEQCVAENFVPDVGMFSSMGDAYELIAAVE